MSYLSKDDIFATDDLVAEPVDVPEWGGTVLVRPFTATERDRFELVLARARDNPGNAQVRAQMAGRCIVDEDGKRLFTDGELGELGSKSAAALDRIIDKVRDLSGMNAASQEAAVEDFGEAPNDGSSSG